MYSTLQEVGQTKVDPPHSLTLLTQSRREDEPMRRRVDRHIGEQHILAIGGHASRGIGQGAEPAEYGLLASSRREDEPHERLAAGGRALAGCSRESRGRRV